jgi:hypothetical protein
MVGALLRLFMKTETVWRMLKLREVVQKGDQVDGLGGWKNVTWSGTKVTGQMVGVLRRKQQLIRLPWPLGLRPPTLGTLLPQGRVVITKPGELTLI